MGYSSADDFHAGGDDVDHGRQRSLDGELQAETPGTTIFRLRCLATWMDGDGSLGSVPVCSKIARAWDGGAIHSEKRESGVMIAAIYNTARRVRVSVCPFQLCWAGSQHQRGRAQKQDWC
jgi:hypothetical protein